MAICSRRRLGGIISSVAASIYFFIIILQVPLFRVPCKKKAGGTSCRTPVEVITCYQLMENEIFLFPTLAMKALLYPGAVAEAFINSNPIPKFHHYNNILINNCQNFHFHQIEVIAGSYLCVAGAMIRILQPDAGRMSLCGALMIILWAKFDEDHLILLHRENVSMIKIYPTLWFALLLTFLSIKRDVRALIRCFRT